MLKLITVCDVSKTFCCDQQAYFTLFA